MVRGGEILTPAGRARSDVVVEGGHIAAVSGQPGASGQPGILDVSGPASHAPTRVPGESGVASHSREIDATGLVVAPGFLDLQCNGAAGIDLTAEPERLTEVAAVLPRWGVTAWLPTIVTSPEEIRRRALAAFAELAPVLRAPTRKTGASSLGATPLGLHFEGPFLAPERRGAHAPQHLRSPDLGLTEAWSRDAGVAMVTLAPELPGALDLVKTLVDRGVVVSLGHSAATATQVRAAVDAGAHGVTHLFNAMPSLHHREPGLAGVALTDERLTVGVIADGLHLDPTVVDLAARALGERLALVTDAVAALGVAPGPIRLGDVEALADSDSVRLPDGTLAGSVLSLDQAVGNLMRFAGVGLEDAVRAVTQTPASLLGLEGERGVIAPGAVGDLVLLDVGAGAEAGVPTSTAGGKSLTVVPDAGDRAVGEPLGVGPAVRARGAARGRVEVVATIIGGEVVYDRRAGEEPDTA